jgi:hypothetical protein
MLEINVLIALIGFSLAGLVILALYLWTQVKHYAHALGSMQRLATAVRREPLAISRMNSRNALR